MRAENIDRARFPSHTGVPIILILEGEGDDRLVGEEYDRPRVRFDL